MTEGIDVREVGQVWMCADCRNKINTGGSIVIRYKGQEIFYGCEHINMRDISN